MHICVGVGWKLVPEMKWDMGGLEISVYCSLYLGQSFKHENLN